MTKLYSTGTRNICHHPLPEGTCSPGSSCSCLKGMLAASLLIKLTVIVAALMYFAVRG